MPVIRLVLVLGIVTGLATLAWSNGSMTMSLMFLGMATPLLPLSVWLLGAIAAGVVTTLAINVLFSLSNYWAVRQLRPSMSRRRTSPPSPARAPFGRSSRAPASESRDDEAWQNWEGYEQPQRAAPPPAPTRPEEKRPEVVSRADGKSNEPVDDWDFIANDDWDVGVRSSNAATSRAIDPVPQGRTSSGFGSDRAPQDTRTTQDKKSATTADQSKLVVDADYRVIIPPYKASPPPEGSETER